ncbi:MMPL family transporter [Kineococcus rubinsiae]|uniref:MMPL family transporter n=1 Tax=Kineococcus rubinsiae TaxID=2609562 RepID=UPI001431E906|nr:MMPL family transporter [Kineococcus rubinsiae]NIZ89714.1 MMPL family transporter [Kineococcus rubinsiae]
MATLLYRLGRFSARRHRLVLGVWALLLAAVAALAFGLPRSASPDTSFSIPGTEASQGLDVLGREFSNGADRASATVVFQAPAGQTLTGANAAALEDVLAQVRAVDGIAAVSDPLAPQMPRVNADQTIAAATVTFATAAGDVSADTSAAFEAATDHDATAGGADVRVEVTSDLPEGGGAHSAEAVGVVVAFIVLLLTYGSLAAAGANLLTAAIGVGVGVLGITALGRVVSLSTTTPALASMLGLAVGIDYALFIFARTRTELRAGAPVAQAVAKATGTAGTAVVFAGTTVVVALVGLAVVDIPFLTQMGLAAAATVAVAVLIALTAVPALLTVLGRRVLPARERHRDLAGLRAADAVAQSGQQAADVSDATLAGPGFLGRWSRSVTRHPVLALLAAVLVVGTAAVPVLSMRTALPSAENADPDSSARQAYDLLVEGFGEGSQSTLVVLVDGRSGSAPEAVATAAATVTRQVQALGDVVAVTPAVPSADGSTQLITVVPGSGPTDAATADLVRDIRSAVASTPGADVLVTGQTALNIDVTQALNDALPVYIALIVVLALALLVMLFRSLAVPVLATLGFLLSLGASLGATVAIYQWGWLSAVFGVAQPAPLLSFMPVLVVGILFGLAMDYQMFLVSAIHEAHSKGHSPTHAVLAGFRRSAPVVVSAAFIMCGVFAGFAFSGEATIGTIGMALTVGVLVDALVVRMVLVPAALTLLGEAAWWMPRWMQRLVPNVDAEGRGLDALLAAEDGGQVPAAAAVPAPRTPAHAAVEGPAVHGTVLDGAGRALAGAALTVTDSAGRQVARGASDEHGRFALPLTAGGTYVLIVAAGGVRPAAASVAVADRPVRRDLRLAGAAALTGRVSAADAPAARHGVAGVVLTLLDVRGAVVATTRTDAGGAYRVDGLTGGSYVLSALSDSHRPVAQGVEVPEAGEATADVRLSAGGRLVGTVSASGRPVREATLTLVDAAGAVVDTVASDEDGGFRFDDLTGGPYTLTAVGYAPVARTVRVEDGVAGTVDLVLGATRPADDGSHDVAHDGSHDAAAAGRSTADR